MNRPWAETSRQIAICPAPTEHVRETEGLEELGSDGRGNGLNRPFSLSSPRAKRVGVLGADRGDRNPSPVSFNRLPFANRE